MTKVKYIKGFDGIRAISILLVLFTHLGLYNKLQGGNFFKENWYLFSGSTGVIIFFSISGFLITSILINEKKLTGRINIRNFFIRRFLRLLPPLLLFFLCIAVLMLSHLIRTDYIALLFSFFYIYNFVPYTYYVGELSHTWSLGVEEQFYFLWPFFISYMKEIKNGIFISIGIIIICLLFKEIFSLPIYFNGKNHYLVNYSYIDRWFIPACLPIIVGSMTSMILFIYKSYLQSLFHKNYLFLIIPLFLFTEQSYISFCPSFLPFLLKPLGVSLFLLWINFNQTSILVKILEFQPLVFLGKISYGVYVYQGLFLRTGPGGNLDIQHFPLNILLVFISAILSYLLIEKKILKYKIKYTS